MGEAIDGGSCAEAAVDAICTMYADMFAGVEDELMRQRATDVKDIRARLIAILLGVTGVDLSRLPAGTVLVARDLTPSMTVGLKKESVAGIITEVGGKGYDDIFVYAPIRPLAEMADKLLGFDGCMSFFAGPTDNLPKIPGGKKLTYTQFDLPLTAIDDFREKGKTDPLFAKLADSCDAHSGLWNAEAEKILFEHFGVK